MCEHCGCNGVEPIRNLMDEHVALLDGAHAVRQAIGAGDRTRAAALLDELVARLGQHVSREEKGVFAALRNQGEFLDEVDALEQEHQSFDRAIAGIDPAAPDFDSRVEQLFLDLEEHVEREDLGLFPVSVVTLGATGWETVEQAHRDIPTFLGGS